jgi:hypothetical protein
MERVGHSRAALRIRNQLSIDEPVLQGLRNVCWLDR